MPFVRPILTSRSRRDRNPMTAPIPVGRMLAARLLRPEPVIHTFSSERELHTCRASSGETKNQSVGDGVEGKNQSVGDGGGQDKANWRSLTPSGRKGLSAHWFLHLATPSERHSARWRAAALRSFLFDFNSSSDGSATCVDESARRLFATLRVGAI
jgi:hypothetical protein